MKTARLAFGLLKLFAPEALLSAMPGPRLSEVDGRRIHPKAQALSDLVALVRGPDPVTSVAESRAQLAGFVERFDRPGPAGIRRIDTELPGAEGPLPARVYLPEGSEPDATLLYLHGGGWIQGSIETHDALCAKIAERAGLRVISLAYRLAPEHRFPAASDDVLAACLHLMSGDGPLACDPARLVVGGDSAGANLTAALMHDLASGGHPMPRAQVLIYPAVDGRMTSPSMQALAESPLLPRSRIDWYLDLYLPEGQDRCAPRFSPLFSGHLSGQPDAFVLVAGHDPLWDDGLSYAQALGAAGVTVEVARFPDQVHGFLNLTKILKDGETAIDQTAHWLRRTMSA